MRYASHPHFLVCLILIVALQEKTPVGVHLHGIPLGMFKSLFLGRVYSGTRMDTIWSFREGQDLCAYVRVATLLMLFRFFARYNTARKIKESQDQYCSKAIAGHWDDLGEFPEDLQWEALVDVLRGRVKVKSPF
jgi:hypothetical protein